jgi:hypothetical protein
MKRIILSLYALLLGSVLVSCVHLKERIERRKYMRALAAEILDTPDLTKPLKKK